MQILGRGYAWFDTGTPDSMLNAAEFVATLERRQGVKICCPEEIAFTSRYIDQDQLENIVEAQGNSAYAKYLKQVLDGTLL